MSFRHEILFYFIISKENIKKYLSIFDINIIFYFKYLYVGFKKKRVIFIRK